MDVTNFSKSAQDDISLISSAKQGDQKAYTMLMKKYRNGIYYMVLKMVYDIGDAEDLTIEILTRAFDRLDYYNGEFTFSTWLYSIARNKTIDFIRKKRLNTISLEQPNDDDEGFQIHITSDELDPEEKLIKEQQNNLLRSFVSELKPKFRNIIRLRYFNDYSYAEISDELKIPLSIVKSHLFRARKMLLNSINNTPIIDGVNG